MIRLISIYIFLVSALLSNSPNSISVGTFLQQQRIFFNLDNGFPSNNIRDIVSTNDGTIFAATDKGVVIYSNKQWITIDELENIDIWLLASNGTEVAMLGGKNKDDHISNGKIFIINNGILDQTIIIPTRYKIPINNNDLSFHSNIMLGTSKDVILFERRYGNIFKQSSKRPFSPNSRAVELNIPSNKIRQMAATGRFSYVATDSALFKLQSLKEGWEQVLPYNKDRSWALHDARAVTIDAMGRLWFASPQGVGYYDDKWNLFTGEDGLPFNDFTTITAGNSGDIWFGTTKGAIHYDGNTWEYRQGKRWLPDDHIRSIAVTPNGDAWFATPGGISVIQHRPITLAEKAKWYEDEIDRYSRRTPYEFVLEVSMEKPGVKKNWKQYDSDNDGLWTSMYGAGECFAYAATGNIQSKVRAKKAFDAMVFLGDVTQGNKHSPPPGYVARTVLPTSGPDPNIGRIDRDKHKKETDDTMWKIYEPRWPTSADGKWYYKTDTSSDELDGHYFLYALYYDLVADTEFEKERVRTQIKGLTDHIIKHGFQLMEHDGTPTRWARYSPEELNFDKKWFVERGLNSLSLLSYLITTAHITGDDSYRDIAQMLIDKHGYAQNMTDMKFQRGFGTGNQSDDEMAFMCYYNLVNYETDPELRSRYAFSFWMAWQQEAPELNPFFNFAFVAACKGLIFEDPWGEYKLEPYDGWLEESIETLIRFPLDRFNWRHTNSHRIDINKFHPSTRTFDDNDMSNSGYRKNGKVIPVDESHFNHWNRDPWRLDTGGDGRLLANGAVFLLPYYMGLYHGFIIE